MPDRRLLSARLLLPVVLTASATVVLSGCGDEDTRTGRVANANRDAVARAAGVPSVAGGRLHENAVNVGLPSVVAVSVSTGGETRNGTGTLLAPGLVVTDATIVTTASGEPAAGVTVREGNGEEHGATVDGIDALSGLAALRVRDLSAVPVARAARGDATLGEQVVGLGFLSSRRAAMRPGTIVTTGRSARGEGSAEVGLFETSASLGAQSLGGPIVNESGRVLGITSRRLSAMVPGSVVALPVSSARRIVRALGEGGSVRRAYLGIETVGLSPTRAAELKLTTATGVLLRSIAPGSPASFSTLRPPTGTTSIGGRSIPTGGDVIVRFENRQVREPEDIDAALATMEPGRRVTLKVVRGDDSVDVKATLGER